MVFFTRSLQDLPKITVNDVGYIIQEACRTSVTKKEKGFKLYVSSYIHNCEGVIWTCKVCMFFTSQCKHDKLLLTLCVCMSIAVTVLLKPLSISVSNKQHFSICVVLCTFVLVDLRNVISGRIRRMCSCPAHFIEDASVETCVDSGKLRIPECTS